ncbi:hypothetical protein D3C74_382270 [compost metagenome]
MSTAPDSPKITLVVAGLNPRCSDHRGSTTWRAARVAPTMTTASPSVAKTRRFSTRTVRKLTGVTVRRCSVDRAATSGTTRVTSPASRLVPTASQYAACRSHTASTAAAANGPTNAPIRCVPASVDSARARLSTGVTSVR